MEQINIYKFLNTMSQDRLTYLGQQANVLAKEIDNITSSEKDKFTVFEVFYIVSLALMAFLNSLGESGLSTFTEIFNQMVLLANHKNKA